MRLLNATEAWWRRRLEDELRTAAIAGDKAAHADARRRVEQMNKALDWRAIDGPVFASAAVEESGMNTLMSLGTMAPPAPDPTDPAEDPQPAQDPPEPSAGTDRPPRACGTCGRHLRPANPRSATPAAPRHKTPGWAPTWCAGAGTPLVAAQEG
ncbi:MAG: hypothetical protein ACRDXE_01630 [Acidimicrobiales bacterium]